MTRLPPLGPRGEGWFAIQVVMLGAIAVSAALGPAVGGLLRLAGIAAGGAALFVSAAIALRCARDLRDAVLDAWSRHNGFVGPIAVEGGEAILGAVRLPFRDLAR